MFKRPSTLRIALTGLVIFPTVVFAQVCMAPPPPPPPPPPNNTLATSLSLTSVPRYGVEETTITEPEAGFPNVWEATNIVATYTSPTGKILTVGGFYYDTNVWKVRFAPAELGTYTWSITWNDVNGGNLGATGNFTSVASSDKGWIRSAPGNVFRLVNELDGSLYTPVGFGDCIPAAGGLWAMDGTLANSSPTNHREVSINTYWDTYSAAGVNFFRFGINNCGPILETTVATTGNTYNKTVLQGVDAQIQKITSDGVHVMLTMNHQPIFPTALAGSDQLAAVNRYYKYLVDRYGVYVDFWELLNEATAKVSGGAVNTDWYDSVVSTITANDPYNHLISTSFPQPTRTDIAIVDTHKYGPDGDLGQDSSIASTINTALNTMTAGPRLNLIGENGNGPQTCTVSPTCPDGEHGNWDPTSGMRYRMRAWTAFFENASVQEWNTSGDQQYYGSPSNLWMGPEERGYITALRAFTNTADPGIQKLALTPTNGGAIRGYGLTSAHTEMGYFAHYTAATPVTTSVTISMPHAATVTWVDPATNAAISTQSVAAGTVTLTSPSFTVDVAFRASF